MELNEIFYNFVQIYYSAILTINEHLKEWAYYPEYIEDYFIENKRLALDTIKGLRDILIALEQSTAPNLATT